MGINLLNRCTITRSCSRQPTGSLRLHAASEATTESSPTRSVDRVSFSTQCADTVQTLQTLSRSILQPSMVSHPMQYAYIAPSSCIHFGIH